ncbi:MAG: NUDIX hydrolase [Desulfatiglandaceae bacterium]
MSVDNRNVEFRYCPVCGGTLQRSVVKEGENPRLVCTRCGYIYYLDPKVVACTLVEIDGGILLLKRAIEPGKGKWVVPGGFVDRGETVEAAAVRETKEECCIDVRIKRLAGVYSYPGETAVIVFYEASPISKNFGVGDESADVRIFLPGDIPWPDLAFPSTRQALEKYIQRQRQEKH